MIKKTNGKPRRLSPPLKWFGGKHYLAPKIVDLMPDHTHYVEAFAGGMSVLWAKPFDGISEVANDIYGRLINFYRHVADEQLFERFLRVVEATPFSQQLWEESCHQSDDPLEDAVRFFIFNRQSRSGMMKDFATLSRNRTRRGMNEQVSSWKTAVDGLQDIHQRLSRVVLLNDDAVSVIQRQDGENTLVYADPPYMHDTRTSSDAYDHEMSELDHRNLLAALNSASSRVILSGYRNQVYDSMLSEWNRVDIPIDNKASGAKSKRTMIESIWMNY